MVIKHKAQTLDSREIQGYILKLHGQLHIVTEESKFTAIPVVEETIMPILEQDVMNEYGLFFAPDIIKSDNLTAEEASQFAWLLRKAKGKIRKKQGAGGRLDVIR